MPWTDTDRKQCTRDSEVSSGSTARDSQHCGQGLERVNQGLLAKVESLLRPFGDRGWSSEHMPIGQALDS